MNISDADSLTNIQVGHSRGGTHMNTMSQFSQDSAPLANIKQSKASVLGEGSTQASTT